MVISLQVYYVEHYTLSNDQVKEDEMGRTCSANGERGMHIEYWWEIQKERDHREDLDVGGWTILK
jgi:hypothetical protein